MKLENKISKLGNNLLANTRFGTKKKFSKVDMWKLIQYKNMLDCPSCDIDVPTIKSRLNEFLNENIY